MFLHCIANVYVPRETSASTGKTFALPQDINFSSHFIFFYHLGKCNTFVREHRSFACECKVSRRNANVLQKFHHSTSGLHKTSHTPFPIWLDVLLKLYLLVMAYYRSQYESSLLQYSYTWKELLIKWSQILYLFLCGLLSLCTKKIMFSCTRFI